MTGTVEKFIKTSKRLRVLWDLDGNVTTVPASEVHRDNIGNQDNDEPEEQATENSSTAPEVVISTSAPDEDSGSESEGEAVVFRNTLVSHTNLNMLPTPSLPTLSLSLPLSLLHILRVSRDRSILS